jgi:hypothetical protein
MATAYQWQGASYVTTTFKTEAVLKLKALLSEPEKNWNVSGKIIKGVQVPNAVAKLVRPAGCHTRQSSSGLASWRVCRIANTSVLPTGDASGGNIRRNWIRSSVESVRDSAT